MSPLPSLVADLVCQAAAARPPYGDRDKGELIAAATAEPLALTQKLLDALVAISGEKTIGVTKADPSTF